MAEPTEPERFETQTDASSTSSADGQDVGPSDSLGSHVNDTQHVGDGHDDGHDRPANIVIPKPPAVYVEPPMTQAHPPIFYIPIPSPGDPLPLIPTKAFVVGPVAPITAKSTSLLDHATQSTLDVQQTGPKQVTQRASGSARDQTDSDVDIPAVHVKPRDSDVDIPVSTTQPAVGKPVPSKPKSRGVFRSYLDVDSNTPVPAPGRVIWSSTDVVPKSVFLTGRMEPLNTFPPVAFGGYTSAIPGSAPKSNSGWTSCGAPAIPVATPSQPCTGWLAPGIPKPPPPPLRQPAGHFVAPVMTPTSSVGCGLPVSPFQTPSSVQFTTPRVIPEPKSHDVQSLLRPRALFQNPNSPVQPDANTAVTGADLQQMQ